jgi:hypothetical protein
MPSLNQGLLRSYLAGLAEITAMEPGCTASSTWEDSNFYVPIAKNAFEMSAEFPLFWPKTRLGDFCSCKLWK